jgi:hypothetical protein
MATGAVMIMIGGVMFKVAVHILALSLIIITFSNQAAASSLEDKQQIAALSDLDSTEPQQNNEPPTSGARNGTTGLLPRRYWQDMTTEEFAGLDVDRVIAVLPIASIEQHGPHLPVCTDACANQAVMRRTLELLPDELPVTVLPMMPIGKATEHSAFPGTLTLETDTVRRCASRRRPEARPVQ